MRDDAGLLGAGAHGVVRGARHVVTGEVVAIKIMPASVLGAVAKELIAQAKMQHPNIVQLHLTQVDLDRRRVYMIMELCQGGELFDRIAESGKLDEPTARDYLVQAASAVAHCHAQNVFHRDLKPENILLSVHGYVRVVDFGLAKKTVDRTYTQCGTPDYVAPEMLTGRGVNQACDW